MTATGAAVAATGAAVVHYPCCTIHMDTVVFLRNSYWCNFLTSKGPIAIRKRLKDILLRNYPQPPFTPGQIFNSLAVIFNEARVNGSTAT